MYKNSNTHKKMNLKKRFENMVNRRNLESYAIAVIGTLLIGVMICFAITPERHDLKVGQIAPKTITATKEVVDEITTQKTKEAASKNVEPSYHQVEGVKERVMENLDKTFDQIFLAQAYGADLLEKTEGKNTFNADELSQAKKLLPDLSLSDYQITILLNSTKEKINLAYTETSVTLQSSYNSSIRDDKLSDSIQNMQRLIGVKVDTNLLLNVVTPVLRHVVEPNFVVDEKSTQQLKIEAMEAVEPVVYTQGQNIVVAGERVERNQLEMLRSLGLLTDKDVNVTNYVGAVILIVMIMAMGLLLLELLKQDVLFSAKKTLVFMLVMVITVAVTILCMSVNKNIIPVIMGGLMLAGLFSTQVAVTGNLMLALIISIIPAGGNVSFNTEIVRVLLTSIIGGNIAIYMLKAKPQRLMVLLSGFCGAVASLVVVVGVGLMTNNDLSAAAQSGLIYATGGMVGTIVALTLQLLFELVFNLATPSKLLELANPKHPLLRKLILEAPGTYYHSIVVANLAEAAADAIGANSALVRTGAYFHDVGKLKRPAYFKENQLGENPHDKMEPYMSATIIMAHGRDGLAMAKQYRLPEEIQKIIIEHHGNTAVGYFYNEALRQAEGKPVDINDFRYDGPKPSTRESAIIMFADTVEAAVRSMQEPTKKKVHQFIKELVSGKIEDGQMSRAPLTLGDIDKMCSAFETVLSGVYHERIEYPSDFIKEAAAQLPAQKKEELLHQEEGQKDSADIENKNDMNNRNVENDEKDQRENSKNNKNDEKKDSQS